MANTNEFEVEGKIQSINFGRTLKGHRFARVRVKGSLANMDVVVFNRAQLAALITARPGDNVKAKGTGRHTGGSYHERGNTSLTARLFKIKTDDAARAVAAHREPEQLSMF